MSVNAVTPYRRDYSVSADQPKVAVPQKAAPAPDEGSPGPTSAPTTGATPPPSRTETPTATPSPSPGPAPQPPDLPMSTPEEQKLDEEVRASLKDKPDELAAYEDLLNTRGFTSYSGTSGRIAMLEQIKNYPEKKVIEGFGRLGDRAWYQGQSAEDQQRSAKMVAFNLSDTTPNANKVRENTMDRILNSDDVKIGWKSIPSDPGTVTFGQAGESGMLWWKQPYIDLNSDLVPAGPGKIDASDSNAVHVVGNTLAHEVNHTITPGGNEQSYGYFMDEYRAWYVGYESENGHPPSAREAYDRAYYLTDKTTGSYGNIGEAMRDDGSDDQKKILEFMAGLMGMDPKDATVDSVRDMSNFNNDGEASAPEKTSDDDPNNLDNH